MGTSKQMSLNYENNNNEATIEEPPLVETAVLPIIMQNQTLIPALNGVSMSYNGLEQEYQDDDEDEPDLGTLATKQVKYDSNSTKVIFDITADHVE